MSQEFRKIGPPVGPEATGQRVDAFLGRAFPFHSRSQWSRLARERRLLVNDRPVRPAHRLRCGDRVAMHHPLEDEPPVDTRIALLAEQGGVIAVYKPGGLPMHEAGFYRRNTFGALLADRFGPAWFPVHRLDRETSGIVVCAADGAIRRRLSAQFDERRVRKGYLAIVSGRTPWDELSIDEPLALMAGTRKPRFGVSPGGLPSRTDCLVRARGDDATLVEALPRTGRTNQIRVHLAHVGHALVGDKIYHADPAVFAAYEAEGDSPRVAALAGFPRHALHASRIGLTHPETGRVFEVECELPEDLRALAAARVAAQGVGARGNLEILSADFMAKNALAKSFSPPDRMHGSCAGDSKA